jgi:hypothetical protein
LPACEDSGDSFVPAAAWGWDADKGQDMVASVESRERRFYFILALVCVLTIFAGFSPSYYLKNVIHAPPPLSAMTHVHGVIFTAWALVFLLQTYLVGFDRPALHRRVGLLAAMLFGGVVVVGITTAINAARLGHAPPGAPAPIIFLAVPLIGIIAAAILVVGALWFRAQRDVHMRLMMSAFIAMTPPATDRIAVGAGFAPISLTFAFAIADLLLVVAISYDLLSRRRMHPAYIAAALVYVLMQGAIIWAFSSPGWLPIAHWAIQA